MDACYKFEFDAMRKLENYWQPQKTIKRLTQKDNNF